MVANKIPAQKYGHLWNWYERRPGPNVCGLAEGNSPSSLFGPWSRLSIVCEFTRRLTWRISFSENISFLRMKILALLSFWFLLFSKNLIFMLFYISKILYKKQYLPISQTRHSSSSQQILSPNIFPHFLQHLILRKINNIKAISATPRHAAARRRDGDGAKSVICMPRQHQRLIYACSDYRRRSGTPIQSGG